MDVIVLGMMQSSVGLTVNYVTFSVFNIFFGIVIVLLYSLAVKFIFRPDTGALAEKVDRFGHLRGQKMNGDQKIALWCAACVPCNAASAWHFAKNLAGHFSTVDAECFGLCDCGYYYTDDHSR